jgi:hypothetical protein
MWKLDEIDINNIDWDNIDLDNPDILSKLWIEESIDNEKLSNWKNKFYFDDINENISNILDINLKEKLTSDSFWIYNWNTLLWLINYSIVWADTNIHIDFIWTSNWNLDKIIADYEFRETFDFHFWKSKTNINWLWTELVKRFINKIDSWTYITLVSVDGSEWFYDKIFNKLQLKWKISLIQKIPEYQILVL